MSALNVIKKQATAILLGIAFFLIILPAGLVMRLYKADPMRREFDESAESYRVPSPKPVAGSLENTR